LKVRSIEKNQRKKIFSNKINKESINKEEVSTEVIINELINESKENIEEKVESLPFEKIINLVNELDSGSGVLIEEIIQKSSLNNTEEFIQKMLERGDIFQNQPGKIKVL